MIAQFTRIFSDFLEEYEDTEVWSEIIAKFNTFPTFTVGDGVDQISLYNSFKTIYYNRELGAETENIFIKNVERILEFCLLKYYQKAKLVSDNFANIMNRVAQLEKSVTVEDSSSDDNKYYLNPINAQADKLNNRDKNESTYDSERTENYDVLTGAYFKTNADVLKVALEINTLYEDIVRDFDSCFMGVF